MPTSQDNKMKAFGLHPEDGPNYQVRELQIPVPELLERDVLIEIEAAALNPIDCKIVQGFGRPEKLQEPKVLGYDGVGKVVKTGATVTFFKEGERVMTSGALNRNGTMAKYTAVDERLVGPAPRDTDAKEAAGIPMIFITAHECLFECLRLDELGETQKTLLVTPGSGSVGSAVIQLAKQIPGVRVIATASRDKTIQKCRDFGADMVINHHRDLKQQLQDNNLETVDMIINSCPLDKNIDQLANIIVPFGKVVSLLPEEESNASLQPFFAKSAELNLHFMFAKTIHGVELESHHHILKVAADLVQKGKFKVPIEETLKLNIEDIKKGHELQSSGKMSGKLIFLR